MHENLKVWWVIMEDLSAPPHNLALLHIIIARQLQTSVQSLAGVTLDHKGCHQLIVDVALKVAKSEMQRLVLSHQLLHRDGGLLNILFDPDLKSAKFIDWGVYTEHSVCIPAWNPCWYISPRHWQYVFPLSNRSGMIRLKMNLTKLEGDSERRRISGAMDFPVNS